MSGPALDSRAGLPPELRVLADLYPRTLWRGHANFDAMTAFWLDRHGMFRDLADRMIAQSQAELDRHADRFLQNKARYVSVMLDQLHTHHMVEDHHYFPQLMTLDDRIAGAFDLLERDHHALDRQMHRLAEAANAAIAQQAGPAAVAALLEAEEGLARFLNRHLADEEEIVVPLILEHAPRLR